MEIEKESNRLLAEHTTLPPETFHPIPKGSIEDGEFLIQLNAKRKFLFDEKISAEKRKFAADGLKITQHIQKIKNVGLANSKLANDPKSEPQEGAVSDNFTTVF